MSDFVTVAKANRLGKLDEEDCNEEDIEDEEIVIARHASTINKNDMKTESTANDAIVSKFSAISLKYYEDKFLRLLFKSQSQYLAASNIRKPPIINRGYYTRVQVVEHFVKAFLDHTKDYPKRQIISLGSGLDTLGYRLLSSDVYKNGLNYIEIDFPNVIQKKLMLTLKREILPLLLCSESVDANKTSPNISEPVTSRSFDIKHGHEIGAMKLLQADLRKVDQLKTILLESGIDVTVPTFILTECVLVYIDKKSADDLLKMLSSLFCNNANGGNSVAEQASTCMWLSYDMIRPDDMFGKTMLSNLTAAGHRIPGFQDYPSLTAQQERFHSTGTGDWDVVKSITMLEAYQDVISSNEKQRIKSLEIFDEVEEWELIMSHYALTVAVKGESLVTHIVNNSSNS